MAIIVTMCKLLLAMGIGFYLYKSGIFTKEINAKLSTLIARITNPCLLIYSVSTVAGAEIAECLRLGDMVDAVPAVHRHLPNQTLVVGRAGRHRIVVDAAELMPLLVAVRQRRGDIVRGDQVARVVRRRHAGVIEAPIRNRLEIERKPACRPKGRAGSEGTDRDSADREQDHRTCNPAKNRPLHFPVFYHFSGLT